MDDDPPAWLKEGWGQMTLSEIFAKTQRKTYILQACFAGMM